MVKKTRSRAKPAKKAARKKVVKKATRKKAKKKVVKKKAKKKATRKKAKKKVVKKAKKKPAKRKAKKTAKKNVVKKKVVKKATRKKAKKKPAKKSQRSSARHRVYNLTKEVPEHHYFVLANGRPVKHVAELASVLDQLEDHVFTHHVTADKNDFNSWIKDIFNDVELARKITGVQDKKHLQLVIYRHLAGHE